MMHETVDEKLDRFRIFISGQIQKALAQPNLKDQGIRAKILLCSIIDYMSKSIYPNENNGDRFRNFVSDYSAWDNWNRISLLHLVRAIEMAEEEPEGFSDLKNWAISELHLKFPPSGRLLAVNSSISKDPICEEVKKLWPKKNGNLLKLNGIRMDQFCHKNLLWCYRNFLMHEYRNPGRGVEGKDDNEPFYQELKTVKGIGESGLKFTCNWELVYPTFFFRDIASSSLQKLVEHKSAINESPFSNYLEGTYWIPKLNEEES
jgi:hypothetical protein